ncbi:MAG: hypothetical protein J0L53_05030 [Spirochaetes bacterium]|nr:hypothetical protein [Spirochaetota bacterium]
MLSFTEIQDYFRKNYETVVYDFALTNSLRGPTYISGRIQKCRFCLTDIEASDQQKKHAISEFLGNEKVYLRQECRACNPQLSVFESSFARYLMFERSLAQIKGKKGIPKFESTNSQFWVSPYDKGIEVGYGKTADFTVNHEKREVKLTAERPRYIPFDIHLSLLKYALSLMPERRLPPFEQSRLFIRRYGVGSSLKPVMFESQIMPVRKAPLVRLLFRRPNSIDMRVPYAQIILDVARYRFQTFIPSTQERARNLELVPYMTEHQTPPEAKDLSSKTERTGEKVPFTFQYFGPVFFPKPPPGFRNGG